MSSFWRGKRILVTGGSGFLGKRVSQRLMDEGAGAVFVPRSLNCDLRKCQDVEEAYADYKPHIVIHLAATVGGLGANMSKPGKFFYDNLKMGMELLDVGAQYGLEKFVQMGSACEYPRDAVVPLKEEDLWNGYPEKTNAPYGVAKKALLVQGQAYRQQYGMNVIHLLSTNLYGPGDNFSLETSHVIPALIRRCFEAKRDNLDSVSVWGTGLSTRDFLYMPDAADAVLLATELYNRPEPVNLGSGQETSLSHVANTIKDLIGFKGDLIWDASKPSGQPRRFLDTSKARHEFGFTAKTRLEEGLEKTIRWYEWVQCAQ